MLDNIDLDRAKFLDNPFWRNDERTAVTAILQRELGNGKTENKVVDIDKYKSDGSVDPLWVKLMREVPRDKIDAFTESRRRRKIEEHNEKQYKEQQGKRARELEGLFSMKLQAFEIDAVKNSKNRKLRSKLRSSTNELEMQAYVTAFILEALEEEEREDAKKKKK
jgi:hypothetical protein